MSRLLVALMGFGAIVSQTSAADSVCTFSALSVGDELRMTYESHGCFHAYQYELTFHRSESYSVTIDEVKQQWSERRKEYVKGEKNRLGELTLSDVDLAGLDALLRFYRSGPDSGCTTYDDITISQQRESATIATEKFEDGSCSTYDRADLMQVTQLVRRLKRSD